MTRIKLFLMRHAKSCSNHVRESSNTDPIIKIARSIRDPGLSVNGRQMAANYGSRLCKRLEAAGFECDKALIASSGLRRAHDTARAVFGRNPTTVRHFKESDTIPKQDSNYTTPNWRAFIKHLSTLVTDNDHVAVIGHRSFLTNQMWPSITGGKKYAGRVNNLDGVLIEGDIIDGQLQISRVREFKYDGTAPAKVSDKCSVPEQERYIQRELRAHTRKMSAKQRVRRTIRTRKPKSRKLD
jgi:phosphohistidine phosphatase SixA